MSKWILVFLLMATLTMSVLASPPRFLKKATVDLNGDGRKEKISLSTDEKKESFTLTINGVRISGKMLSSYDGFQIVDIDKKDKLEEIAFHSPGPSEDDEYWIYRFYGKSIEFMGYFPGRPTFTGKRVVFVRDWMDFWWKTDKYVLTGNQKMLQLVPQKSYSVGKVTTVTKNTPIYKTKTMGSKIVTELKPSSKVTILQYWPTRSIGNDQTGRYLVMASNGLAGWTDFNSISLNFSGLDFAD